MDEWPIGPNGLLYDREWALLAPEGGGGPGGRVLTQKTCPRMATLRPTVDLRAGTLTLEAEACGSTRMVIDLNLATQQQEEGKGGSIKTTAGGKEGMKAVLHTVDSLLSGSASAVVDDGTSGGGSDVSSETASSSYCEGYCEDMAGGPATLPTESRLSMANQPRAVAPHMSAASGIASAGESQVAVRVRVCSDTICGLLVEPQRALFITSDGRSASTPGALGYGRGARLPPLDPIEEWFRVAIGVPCRLVRHSEGSRVAAQKLQGGGQRGEAKGGNDTNHAGGGGVPGTEGPTKHASPACPSVGFANDAQYMLLNSASLLDLNSRLGASGRLDGLTPDGRPLEARHFRPNLVVSGFGAYSEDHWEHLQVYMRLDYVWGIYAA